MARVVHFELAADDPERAAKFYEGVFGWQIQKWDGPQDYWLATTGPKDTPGIDGAIMRRHPVPSQPSSLAMPLRSSRCDTRKPHYVSSFLHRQASVEPQLDKKNARVVSRGR